MIIEHSAGAVLYRIDDGSPRYLLVRSESGHIGFPKGHLEAGESTADAALREIREETGVFLDCIDDSFCFENEYMMKNGNLKHVTLFIARYSDDNMRSENRDLDNFLCDFNTALGMLEYEDYRKFLSTADTKIRSSL